MVLRLAVLTPLLAIFAFGFSTLVHSNNEAKRLAFAPFSGCYDQGVVCSPQTEVR